MAFGNSQGNDIESYMDISRVVDAGGGDDVVLFYGVADDILVGGAGNDTLQAGLGDDIYRTSQDFGWDEITDIGGDDSVEFDVNEDKIWFARSGNDLNVSVIGTQNGMTIKNWYSDSTARIESFYAGDNKVLTAGQVDQLVSVMSAFAPPSGAVMPAAAQSTVNTLWQ